VKKLGRIGLLSLAIGLGQKAIKNQLNDYATPELMEADLTAFGFGYDKAWETGHRSMTWLTPLSCGNIRFGRKWRWSPIWGLFSEGERLRQWKRDQCIACPSRKPTCYFLQSNIDHLDWDWCCRAIFGKNRPLPSGISGCELRIECLPKISQSRSICPESKRSKKWHHLTGALFKVKLKKLSVDPWQTDLLFGPMPIPKGCGSSPGT